MAGVVSSGEAFRKSADGLRSIGITNRDAPEGPALWFDEGWGDIQIDAVPITSIHVQETTGDESLDVIRAAYRVPDERLSQVNLERFRLYSVKLKDFPIVGEALGTKWKGNDGGTGLLATLNGQRAMNAYLCRMSRALTIRADTLSGCWNLTVEVGTTGGITFGLGSLLTNFEYPFLQVPTLSDILCYRAVARRLLRTRISKGAYSRA